MTNVHAYIICSSGGLRYLLLLLLLLLLFNEYHKVPALAALGQAIHKPKRPIHKSPGHLEQGGQQFTHLGENGAEVWIDLYSENRMSLFHPGRRQNRMP